MSPPQIATSTSTHLANYWEMLGTAVTEFKRHVEGMTQEERQQVLLTHWHEQDM